MMYKDSTGTNITLSPRFGHDHFEPTYTHNVAVTLQPGSGVANDKMTAFVLCTNCRTWNGGSLDISSTTQKFIFASGPDGDIKSNSGSAAIRMHSSHGSFTMDMTKAVGVGAVPFLLTTDSSGTIENSNQHDHDFPLAFHGIFMIFAFYCLMPAGVVILRVLNSPKWHGVNQALSFAVAILGVFLGLYVSTFYNRVSSL